MYDDDNLVGTYNFYYFYKWKYTLKIAYIFISTYVVDFFFSILKQKQININ